jgi:hypothetical protein
MKRGRVSKDEQYADAVWVGAAELNRLMGGRPVNETIWKCDQMRAGQLYSRMMFDTREEAEQFARKMQHAEPDQMFSIEAVEARQVWN